jgi:D-ribose pyranose/furanose isomerase RbsD
MPRISLYRPDKSKDYDFIDARIFEMFTVGGTDVLIHKYLGPKITDESDATAEQPVYDAVKETNIQDLLFLENRDRKYDKDIYTLRGHYNIQDQDFDLRQFGLFLSNDTIYLTIHINSSVRTIGRKIMSGDVIELPHMKDEYAANEYSLALKRFYVVEDINRAAEGFSQTWYPHLYRLKLKQIVDSQEYKEILDLPAEEGSSQTLRDLLSTYEKEMQINEAVIAQAEDNARQSGYNTTQFYTVSVLDNGEVAIISADYDTLTADGTITSDIVFNTPDNTGYKGYLVGDGFPPNGAPFGIGSGFPSGAALGDYFLRIDLRPNRLYRYDGTSWRKVEDAVRTTLTPTNNRNTLKGTFINNTTVNTIAGEDVIERQALSKALRAKADN